MSHRPPLKFSLCILPAPNVPSFSHSAISTAPPKPEGESSPHLGDFGMRNIYNLPSAIFMVISSTTFLLRALPSRFALEYI
jgi:hypothetical protein